MSDKKQRDDAHKSSGGHHKDLNEKKLASEKEKFSLEDVLKKGGTPSKKKPEHEPKKPKAELLEKKPHKAAASKEAEELRDALEASQELVLRMRADMENVRHRAQLDVQKAHKFGVESFVKSLLPVVDSLERALESISDDEAHKHQLEGVELTLKMFLDSFEKSGVKQVNPLHEPFNHDFHEAVTVQKNPEVLRAYLGEDANECVIVNAEVGDRKSFF